MLLTRVSGTWRQPAIPLHDEREEISIGIRPDSSLHGFPGKARADVEIMLFLMEFPVAFGKHSFYRECSHF